jgi:hypothetical protein
MKLVLRPDVGRWSRILRVWEIVKNRDLTPDDKQEQATESSDFELITWLVIKSGRTDG